MKFIIMRRKKILHRFGYTMLLLAVSLFFGSCSKVNVDLAGDFVDNSTTNLVLVDSATLEISTVYVDSFITSAGGSILVGGYKDAAFGNVNCNSFLQLGAPESFSIPNGAVFDSLELILKLNKTFYGDTTAPYTIAVHQLTDVIKLPNEQYYFYNNNKRNYNATALGSTTVLVRPATRDSIAIRLSQTLGQQLFDKLFSTDEAVTSHPQFIEYFKGLAIVNGSGNNLVLGFKDSLVMRLHYRNPGVINEDAVVDFAINDNTTQFNSISVDRSATPIAALGANNKQIFSGQSQHAGFSQYITGTMMKIRFPYLHNLLQLNDFVKLIRADLVLKPVKGSFENYYTLPPQLRLSTTDQYNLPGADLTAYSSSTSSYAAQYGNLYIDRLYGTQTSYSYDVTAYLQDLLTKTDNSKYGVLLLPPDPTQVFNRVMIGDGQHAESKSEVKIYYATVK